MHGMGRRRDVGTKLMIWLWSLIDIDFHLIPNLIRFCELIIVLIVFVFQFCNLPIYFFQLCICCNFLFCIKKSYFFFWKLSSWISGISRFGGDSVDSPHRYESNLEWNESYYNFDNGGYILKLEVEIST